MLKKRKFKYGVFDRDGVLVDSVGGYAALFTNLVHKFGLKPSLPPREIFHREMNHNWLESLPAYLPPAQQALIPKFVEEFAAQALTQKHESKLFEAVVPVIAQLNKRGFLLFVSSSASSDVVEDSLARFGLAEAFSLVRGCDVSSSSHESKDDHLKEFAMHVGESLENFGASAFFLGDAPYDMQVARRNDLLAVGITTSHKGKELRAAGADVIINTHEELLPLVTS